MIALIWCVQFWVVLFRGALIGMYLWYVLIGFYFSGVEWGMLWRWRSQIFLMKLLME